jgi:uncharacterized protein
VAVPLGAVALGLMLTLSGQALAQFVAAIGQPRPGERRAQRAVACVAAGHQHGNPGTPTEHGLSRDARAAHRFLVDEAGLRPGRLLYYGESLGVAVVTRLAAEHAPAGLVLRSASFDLASVGRVHYLFLPVRAMLKDRSPVAELMALVAVPTAVVYGTKDSVVPPEQSRAVAAAAGETHVVAIEGADHNDRVLFDGAQLIGAIVELVDRVRQAP